MKEKKAPSRSSGRKRAKVVTPKMSNVYHPEGWTLEQWQVALRQQASEKETFHICERDAKYCPGEYVVRNFQTRNDYKVVYRGQDSEWNYCSCMDFKVSGLGTCKHLEAVKSWVKDKRRKVFREEPSYSSVYVDYKGTPRVRLRIGEDNREEFEKLAVRYFDSERVLRRRAYAMFDTFLTEAKRIDESFRCYGDALDMVIGEREKVMRKKMMAKRYPDEVLDGLLAAGLYPYQKEGVRFAVQAGKAIIADEMGLGKTIQAIAAAEIYLREGLAASVLVVCPTTLKYQWKKEIEKFTGSDTVEAEEDYVEDDRIRPKVVVVEGNPKKRRMLYAARAPYKIVSYHTMANDIREQGRIVTDLLVMDEIQRLKNWNTLISKAARKIESRWSVLLSGTPLENKLDELFANMELVDQFCLGPYYLFKDKHILTDPVKGNVVGYRNLNSIGEKIKCRLIRRTKNGVRLQLPKRNDQFVLVPMTEEQASMHAEFNWDLSIILRKYEKYHFITEQDRKKILLLLSKMRMVADSTFILEQDLKTRCDVKIDELMNILQSVIDGGTEKVVIFSEWERMARLVAMELDKRGVRFEYLNGSIPAKQRGELVNNFTSIPESRVFISTDAGSTGLNLQVASILVNLDLPWNPAVLEQRVARIYRIGQDNPVQIINLVSKNSIEEGMIQKLRFKSSMFEGVLDGGADSVFVSEDKFKKFMEDIQSVMKETPVVEYVDETDDLTDSAVESNPEVDPAVDPAVETSTAESNPAVERFTADSNPAVESTVVSSTVGPSAIADRPSGIGTTTIVETADRPATGRIAGPTADPVVAPTAGSAADPVVAPTAGRIAGPIAGSAADPTAGSGVVEGPVSPAGNESVRPSSVPDPQNIVNQGISFLTGLAQTLKSPQATRQLVDSIVEVDADTGQSHIKIPVTGKDTVLEIFSLFGKLLQK